MSGVLLRDPYPPSSLERGGQFRYHVTRQGDATDAMSVFLVQTGSFAVNIRAKTTTDPATTMSPAEWEARVDLAAVYRLVAHHGWDDGIYNHCSMRVPGEDRKFLMKRHELLWTEVTASNLVKVSMDEDLDERARRQSPGLHAARRGPAWARRRQLRGARSHPDWNGDCRPQERAADD